MSDKIIPVLSAVTALLVGVYVTLVITTIYFATWQTQGISQIRELEGTIATLEADYYDAIARINNTDPGVHGLGEPLAVRYVTQVTTAANVSFASR